MRPFNPLDAADTEETDFFNDDRNNQTAEEAEGSAAVEREKEEPEATEPEEVETEEPEEGDEDEEVEDEREAESRRVPLAELKRERQRRQEYERQLDEVRQRYDRLQDRTDRMLQAIQQQAAANRPAQQEETAEKKPEGPPEPDRQEDPFGWMQWKIETMERQLQGRAEQEQEQQRQIKQQQEQEEHFRTFYNELQKQEAGFRQSHQDYDTAVQHLANARNQELIAFGYHDPQQRAQIIQSEFVNTSANLMMQGHNPAEVFYNAARQKGYGQKPSAETRPAQTNKNDAVKKHAETRKRTASPSGGSESRRDVPSIDALSDMDDSEFDKFFDKLWRDT